MFYRTYHEAYDAAVLRARALDQAVGIEPTVEYGRRGFRIALVPNRPEDRSGWEVRCEVVLGSDPLMEKGTV